MKQSDYVYIGEPIPRIESPEHKDFLINFQKAMLQSLVTKKQLTAAQTEQVMDIIAKKTSFK